MSTETKDPVQIRAKLKRIEKANERAMDLLDQAARELNDASLIVTDEPVSGLGIFEGDLKYAEDAARIAYHILAVGVPSEIKKLRDKTPRKTGASR